MLTRPPLKDEDLIDCLRAEYGLIITKISFLPLGADFNTAVYRATTIDGLAYFLKLRSGEFLEASVLVPKYLADICVIPPIATKTGQLWATFGAFKTILYPYVEGKNGVEAPLSEAQWAQFGATIRKLHNAELSAFVNGIPREAFSSQWRDSVKAFLERIEKETFEESIAVEAAVFLKSKSAQIFDMVQRTEALAHKLQQESMDFVLCHADIHGWNLLIDEAGALYIVDWDTLIFAPKERDLMFVGAGIWNSGRMATEETVLFCHGYGEAKINQEAICYYRLERIIQDIAYYCDHIFSSAEKGDDQLQSFKYLKSDFLPDGPIERVYEAGKVSCGF